MNRTTILTRSAVAVTAALLVAACGSSAKSSSSSTTTPTTAPTSAMPSMDMSSAAPAAGTDTAAGEPTIHIKGFQFSAPSSPIKAGSTFTVINDDGVPHTYESVKKGIFDSGTIKAGASAEVTAPAAGTYDVKCDFHPSMHGSLTVS